MLPLIKLIQITHRSRHLVRREFRDILERLDLLVGENLADDSCGDLAEKKKDLQINSHPFNRGEAEATNKRKGGENPPFLLFVVDTTELL